MYILVDLNLKFCFIKRDHRRTLSKGLCRRYPYFLFPFQWDVYYLMRKDGGQKTARDVDIKCNLLQVLDICHMNQLPSDSREARTYLQPITAIGFSEMFIFQLDNTKR